MEVAARRSLEHACRCVTTGRRVTGREPGSGRLVNKPGSTHCPAQAGAAETTDGAGHLAADAVVTVYENGPLIVRGRFTITTQDGQPIPAGRKTVALCRCGQSGLKPFCDGSHALMGFRAPGHAESARPGTEPADGGGGAGQPLTRVGDAAAQPASQREPAAH